MERNHLGPQQVLSRGNTGRDGNCVYAAVADNLRCAPVTSVVTVLLNLEPSTTDTSISQGIVNLLQIRQRGPLVGRIHHIVGSRGQGMSPDSVDSRSSLDCDDVAGRRRVIGRSIASEAVRGNILDRAVIGRRPYAVADRVRRATGRQLDKDGMCGRGRGAEEEGKCLHLAWHW